MRKVDPESAAPALEGPPGGRAPAGSGVAVLIPALDEEEALPGVLEALDRDLIRHLVVVDNGSRDDTGRVARDAGATVIAEPRRGYGAACLAGLRHLDALSPPPAAVAFMDGDASDDPSSLPELVEPVLAGRADLVLGVRRSPRGSPSGAVPLHARLGNRLVLGLVRVLFGRAFADLPPYRAVSYRRLRELEMDDADWGWTLQMQIRAHRAGHRILEVDVPHRPRAAGRSKISGSLRASIRVGLKMAYTLVRERIRKG